MKNKEEGLQEIYERIKANRVLLGVKTFKWIPTSPIQEEDMPCIFLLEGTDNIIKHSGRSTTGFPAQRVAEVTIELVTSGAVDIKALFRKVRQAIFAISDSDPIKYDSRISDKVFFNESRIEGPEGYGLPNVKGMRLILDVVYSDENF